MSARDAFPADDSYVSARLEEACLTLMALPGSVGPKKLGAQSYGYVAQLVDSWKGGIKMAALPAPDRIAIARMDDALQWPSLIPNRTMRRIVSARALTAPHTGRHVFTWKDIGLAVGCSRFAVADWHARGLATIVVKLAEIGRTFTD